MPAAKQRNKAYFHVVVKVHGEDGMSAELFPFFLLRVCYSPEISAAEILIFRADQVQLIVTFVAGFALESEDAVYPFTADVIEKKQRKATTILLSLLACLVQGPRSFIRETILALPDIEEADFGVAKVEEQESNTKIHIYVSVKL